MVPPTLGPTPPTFPNPTPIPASTSTARAANCDDRAVRRSRADNPLDGRPLTVASVYVYEDLRGQEISQSSATVPIDILAARSPGKVEEQVRESLARNFVQARSA